MSRPALPGFALSAGIVWLLAGAMYKLFDGRPGDLPSTVLEYSPLGSSWDTFRYAIVGELAVVGLVIAVPRLGWLALVGVFATFLAALWPLYQAGETSCGCFGSNIEISPAKMMMIDGGLLLLVLISRPWRLPKGAGLGWAACLPLLAAAVAGPLMKLEEPKLIIPDKSATSELVVNGETEDTVPPKTIVGPGAENRDGGTTEGPTGDETAGGDGPTASTVDPPAIELPEFLELDLNSWVGQDFFSLDIVAAGLLDMSQGIVGPNGHVVVYRQNCEVCKEHLEMLAAEQATDPAKWAERPIALLRIVEAIDTPENNMCTVLPTNVQMMSLPPLKRGYGLTTPTTFDLDDAMMVKEVVDVRKLMGH